MQTARTGLEHQEIVERLPFGITGSEFPAAEHDAAPMQHRVFVYLRPRFRFARAPNLWNKMFGLVKQILVRSVHPRLFRADVLLEVDPQFRG